MEYDFHNDISQTLAIIWNTHTQTVSYGRTIDTKGFNALEYIVTSGAITAGDFAGILQESDTGDFTGEEVAVDPELVLGSVNFIATTNNNEVQRMGSVGKKRYQRIGLSTAGGASGQFTASAVLSVAQSMPTPLTAGIPA
jgi:hypothetical protein